MHHARHRHLLDRLMGSVGLSGRAFIRCCRGLFSIHGIMATRTIPNLRDRVATIMVSAAHDLSARLPVARCDRGVYP